MNKTLPPKPSKASIFQRVVIFLLSWVLVSLFGFVALLIMGGAIGPLFSGFSEDVQISLALLIFLGISNIVLLLIVLIRTYNTDTKPKLNYFKKYSSIGLWLGFGVSLLISIVLVIVVFTKTKDASDISSTSTNNCSSLSTQLSKLEASIVPVITNEGSGTAFAINDRGTLLTAYHVVEGAKYVKADYVSGTEKLKIIDTAPQFDLALLKINTEVADHLQLTTNYNVADELYAYGYPGNTFSAGQPSLSSGLLSRVLTHEDLKLNDKRAPNNLELVQTDMALNPGNSGGPIVNRCGVVGVVSMKSNVLALDGIASEEGINFAISSKTIQQAFGL